MPAIEGVLEEEVGHVSPLQHSLARGPLETGPGGAGMRKGAYTYCGISQQDMLGVM